MDLHSLQVSRGARKPRKRLGRGAGSGTGKTSGKGHKGQMARKGHKHKLGFEGGQMPLIRRIPKRGFKNPTKKDLAPVNVGSLSIFGDGDEITETKLKEHRLVKGKVSGVKILGGGELKKKLTVRVTAMSESARAKIEAAGGVCEVTV